MTRPNQSDLSPENTQTNVEAVSNEYSKKKYIYDAIVSEATFIINDSLINERIKVHGVEHRVKELSSLLKKCSEKNIKDPFSEIFDIAGLRVICLFRSDLEK